MLALQLSGGPELLIVVLVALLPVAAIYLAYQLFRGTGALRSGVDGV